MKCKNCGSEDFIFSWSAKMLWTSSGDDPFSTIMPDTIEYDDITLSQ